MSCTATATAPATATITKFEPMDPTTLLHVISLASLCTPVRLDGSVADYLAPPVTKTSPSKRRPESWKNASRQQARFWDGNH